MFNWETMEWTQQGDLNTGRINHCCGLHGGTKVIAAGGKNAERLITTETFDLSNPGSGWVEGPILPGELNDAAMTDLGGHAIISGGYPNEDLLLEYTEAGWVELDQRLYYGRWYHDTVLISDDLLDC